MIVEEVSLAYGNINLTPLKRSHRDGLLNAANDGELWKLWYTSVPDKNSIDSYIETALQEKEEKKSLPFVVFDKASKTIIGSTRFMNIELNHKRLEIGHTWYASSYHRTGVNSSCKLLLLQHAFETLDAIAVEFRTHFYNQKSRNAIERLGAKLDGVLRNHRIDKNGLLRDTVVYSILNSEWPTVKNSLYFKLNQYQ